MSKGKPIIIKVKRSSTSGRFTSRGKGSVKAIKVGRSCKSGRFTSSRKGC